MQFIRNIKIIFKKDFFDFFSSPLVYVVAAFFALTTGWTFYNALMNAPNLSTGSLSQSVLIPFFFYTHTFFMLLIPLLTMGTVAEEVKNNTISLLFRAKISITEILLGKFLGVFSVCAFLLLVTLFFPIILAVSGFSDWGTVFSAYLGLSLAITFYIFIGIFASTLVSNQIIAALLCFSFLLGIGLSAISLASLNNPLLAEIGHYMSNFLQLEMFFEGLIRSYNVFYFVSFSFLFLYLAEISWEAKRW